MQKQNNDPIVCIAGASGSLGFAIARKYVSKGYSVAISGSSLEKLESAKEKLANEFKGSSITAVSCAKYVIYFLPRKG